MYLVVAGLVKWSWKFYTVQYAAIKKIIRGWRGRLVGMFLYYPGAWGLVIASFFQMVTKQVLSAMISRVIKGYITCYIISNCRMKNKCWFWTAKYIIIFCPWLSKVHSMSDGFGVILVDRANRQTDVFLLTLKVNTVF